MPRTERLIEAIEPGSCRLSLQKGGVAIAITVPDVINCAGARSRCIEQLVDLAACGLPVALRPAGLTEERSAALVEFFRILGAALGEAGFGSDALEITIDAARVPAAAAYFLARHRFGARIVNLVADAAAQNRWQDWLWRTRCETRRRLACWPQLRSACPLLATETATDVLPGAALQVPAQTAWLHTRVELDDFLRPDGRIDGPLLEATLQRVVDDADLLYDTSRWPTPAMQQDAWLNRRLAIRIGGFGDLVQRMQLDPTRHATLRMLEDLLATVRAAVVQRSRLLALDNETLPAIAAGAPRPCAHGEAGTSAWQQRWLHAVRQTATRNRNLLAMSPYAVFPRGDADYRYVDLLPLLAHADACAVDGQPPLHDWSIGKFAAFHARIRAILGRLCSDYVVAEQP